MSRLLPLMPTALFTALSAVCISVTYANEGVGWRVGAMLACLLVYWLSEYKHICRVWGAK